MFYLIILLFSSRLDASIYELKLQEAEEQGLTFSNLIKSKQANQESAMEQVESKEKRLWPKLEIKGYYQYNFTLPEFAIMGTVPTIFGTYNNFAVGPYASYKLLDFKSERNTYEAASLMAKAKEEDKKSSKLQILRAIREAYIQVQRGLEELRLTNQTLELSKAQERDILIRYKNGASSKLDLVTAQRSVLGYEIQFQKRQADLSLRLQDLLSLIGQENSIEIKKPGPASLKKVSLVLKFDPIQKSLEEETGKNIPPPDENHPQLKSLDNQARSSDLTSSSYKSKQLPVLEIYGGVYYTQPNFPNPIQYWNEFAGVTLTMPLFMGDPASNQAAEQKKLAMATEFQREQTRTDLKRDYEKVKIDLESLNEQKALAEKDVAQSEIAAKLYYTAYKAGKVDLLEVQNANLQALEAKVSLTRTGTQILSNLALLKSLSGTLETRYE
jgi:outer membrane protein TolC